MSCVQLSSPSSGACPEEAGPHQSFAGCSHPAALPPSRSSASIPSSACRRSGSPGAPRSRGGEGGSEPVKAAPAPASAVSQTSPPICLCQSYCLLSSKSSLAAFVALSEFFHSCIGLCRVVSERMLTHLNCFDFFKSFCHHLYLSLQGISTQIFSLENWVMLLM